jgi:hypothetical protein
MWQTSIIEQCICDFTETNEVPQWEGALRCPVDRWQAAYRQKPTIHCLPQHRYALQIHQAGLLNCFEERVGLIECITAYWNVNYTVSTTAFSLVDTLVGE